MAIAKFHYHRNHYLTCWRYKLCLVIPNPSLESFTIEHLEDHFGNDHTPKAGKCQFCWRTLYKRSSFWSDDEPKDDNHAPKGSTRIIQPKKTSGRRRRPWVRGWPNLTTRHRRVTSETSPPCWKRCKVLRPTMLRWEKSQWRLMKCEVYQKGHRELKPIGTPCRLHSVSIIISVYIYIHLDMHTHHQNVCRDLYTYICHL